MFSTIASATSSVASFHVSTTRLVALLLGDQAVVVLLLDRGDEVLVLSRISPFDGGMTTSFLEMVMPACVAYWNPRSLNASSTWAIAGAPNACTSSSTKPSCRAS